MGGGGERVSIWTRAAPKVSILVGLKHFPEQDTWLSHSVETKWENSPLLREFNYLCFFPNIRGGHWLHNDEWGAWPFQLLL